MKSEEAAGRAREKYKYYRIKNSDAPTSPVSLAKAAHGPGSTNDHCTGGTTSQLSSTVRSSSNFPLGRELSLVVLVDVEKMR